MYWWEATNLTEATMLLAQQTYYPYFGDYFYVFIIALAFLIGAISKNASFGLFNSLFYYTMIALLSFYGYIPVGTWFLTIGGIFQAGAIIILALLLSGGYL